MMIVCTETLTGQRKESSSTAFMLLVKERCYEMMVLQLEDVVECLTVLHPEFDYLFV
jgi:hypothetical protein